VNGFAHATRWQRGASSDRVTELPRNGREGAAEDMGKPSKRSLVMSKQAKKKGDNKSVPARTSDTAAAAAAHGRTWKEGEAIAAGEIVAINVDVPSAVAMVLGAHVRLVPMRAEIVRQLPEFPIAMLDKLEDYALGAWYAHLLEVRAPTNPRELAERIEEARGVKARMLASAESLALHGYVDMQRVREIRAGSGNIDLANDCGALNALFAQAWPEIADKTPITAEEVARAGELGPILLVGLGARRIEDAQRSPAGPSDRARAFTLMVRAYDQCRRAVTYLRWNEGDANDIAPGLSGPRTRRRKDNAPIVEPDDGDPPSPTPGERPAPAPNGTPVRRPQ
jgi:hypothetical protein